MSFSELLNSPDVTGRINNAPPFDPTPANRPRRAATRKQYKLSTQLSDEEQEADPADRDEESDYEPPAEEAQAQSDADEEIAMEKSERNDFRLPSPGAALAASSLTNAYNSAPFTGYSSPVQPMPGYTFGSPSNASPPKPIALPSLNMLPMRQETPSFAPPHSPVVPPQLQANVRLTSSGKPSHARKVPDGHVKRPRNAFILFRSYACTTNLVPSELGITDHRHISRIVGQLWKGLSPEEKRVWEAKAQKEKEEHKKNNPDYRYRPVYRREGVIRRRRRKNVAEDELDEEDRKCEVVARVLLEGGSVDETRVKRELEVQRQKDHVEGKDRSRSRSTTASATRQRNAAAKAAAEQHGDYMIPSNGNKRPRNFKAESEAPHGSAMFHPHLYSQQSMMYQSNFPPQFDEFGMDRRRPAPLELAHGTAGTLFGQPSPATLMKMNPGLGDMPAMTPRTLTSLQMYTLQGTTGGIPSYSPISSNFGLRRGADDHTLGRRPSSLRQEFNGDHLAAGPFAHGRALSADAADLAHGPHNDFFTPHPTELPRPSSVTLHEHATSSLRVQTNDLDVQQQPYSAIGELAASSNLSASTSESEAHNNYRYSPAGAEAAPIWNSNPPPMPMAGLPDPTVGPRYVYLSAEEAKNNDLIESILAQGLGVSYDAET